MGKYCFSRVGPCPLPQPLAGLLGAGAVLWEEDGVGQEAVDPTSLQGLRWGLQVSFAAAGPSVPVSLGQPTALSGLLSARAHVGFGVGV